MPRKYKKSSRVSGKTMSKYRKKMSLPLGGKPSRKVVRMRYLEGSSTGNGSGAALSAYTLYRANSVYDPRWAVGGGQPIGFDDWKTLYGAYVVLGAKCKVRFASPTDDCYVGVSLLSDSSQLSINPTVTCSNPNSTWTLVNSGGGTSKCTTITKNYSARKFTCRGQSPLTDEDQQADVGTNPENGPIFQVWAAPIDQSTTLTSVNYVIELEYIVAFFDPQTSID